MLPLYEQSVYDYAIVALNNAPIAELIEICEDEDTADGWYYAAFDTLRERNYFI